jgi:hypothetical protein
VSTFKRDLGTRPTVIAGWDGGGPLATLDTQLATQGAASPAFAARAFVSDARRRSTSGSVSLRRRRGAEASAAPRPSPRPSLARAWLARCCRPDSVLLHDEPWRPARRSTSPSASRTDTAAAGVPFCRESD